jgi:CRP-like cAMP-binding protein
MGDLDPAALTERVLRLGRSLPLSRMTTDELTLLALAGREVTYTRRTLLIAAEDRATALYVPLTGRLRAVRDGQAVPGDPVRDFYGGTSLLSRSVIAADIVAEPGTALFVLDRDVFLALLEEHGALARSMLHHLTLRLIELRGTEIVTSGIRADGDELPKFASADLLSRMRLLRDALGLESRTLPVVAQLARATHVRRTAAGAVLWEPFSGAAGFAVPVKGAIELRRNGVVAGRVQAGEGVGMAEAVAAAPVSYGGVAVEETTTVELSCAEMQEAIEDHDDFCLDLIRVMSLELHKRMFGSLGVSNA